MDSKGLKVPTSESDKLEVSVVRFSDKAEHLPIKKRRFLFRASPPPLDTTSSEGTERLSACLNSSSQEDCLPAASSTVADVHQNGNSDRKVDGKELVKAKASEDEDICGISLVAVAACNNSLGGDTDLCEGSGIVLSSAKSLEASCAVKSKENSVKSADMSAEEIDSHISTAPSTDAAASIMDRSSPAKATSDNSAPDESTLDNSCSQPPLESECGRMNPVTSKIEEPVARDDRLHWDLNTVMDAWEEPLECEHDVYAADAARSKITYAEEEKSPCKEGHPEGLELGLECGSAPENIGNIILPVKLEECEPGSDDVNKLLFPAIERAKTNSLHNQIDNSRDAIPANVHSTLTLQYPAYDISSKHVNVNCKATDDLSGHMAAGTGFSLDYSIPLGFNPCIHMHAEEPKVDISSTIFGSGNNVAITSLETIIENEKHNLSLATMVSLENGVHQSGSTFNEAEVKKAISSNGMTMENLVGKGTDLSQETNKGDHKALNPTTFGSLLVTQSSVATEVEDQPAVISSMYDAEVPIKAEQSPLTETSEKPMMMMLTETSYHKAHESCTVHSDDLVSCKKEACEVPVDNGFNYENFQSDIQAGSEVDNVDELSFGYDSQYEDGEVREASIQTWEGYEGEDRENEHRTDNMGGSFNQGTSRANENSSECVPEVSSRIRSTDVGSQRGADEMSSVVLPEKLESSDQVSGSEPNEASNITRQVSMKDASQLDQWKMNVSGWDILPENHSTSNNVTMIRDLSSIKFSRIQRYESEKEDVETKAECPRFYRREPILRVGGPPERDAFLNRGSLRMQGCSSSNADDSTSRSLRESGALRSLRRGKYSRGRGMWNHSPGRDRDLNRLHSLPYHGSSFRHSMLEDDMPVDNLTNEVGVNPIDDGGPGGSSYITRQSLRSRLRVNRELDDFRARLGLRPSGDTCHNRSANVGRGRCLRYGSRQNDGGPRRRYRGPANDDYDEALMEYSHPFPSRRRCFSPIERRENDSRARTRSPISDGYRRRTRSPNMRCDGRMRRPRSPSYRIGFGADDGSEYSLEPGNSNSPPSSRWVNYKQRSYDFERTDPPVGERFSFYDPSRKTKQNENHKSGRFSEGNGGGPRYLGSDGDLTDHGYRRGGFVRRGRPVKHCGYDDEDGYGPVYDSRGKDGLEFHGRGNPKPYSNDGRFLDLPRRLEKW